ncbi:hypothetical protein LguiA_013561 [Lonicera macranthoides]
MVKPSSRNCYYSDDEKSSPPQFFKIYTPHNCSQCLRIPPAFIKYFKGVPPSKSIIKTHVKTTWCIDVNKVDNYYFFQKGWPEFVRDNSLEFGDFLVFCYIGNSEFYVPIFGINNCRKEVPITTRNSDKPQSVLQGNPTVEASNSKEKMCVDRTVQMDTTLMPSQDNTGDVGTPCKFVSRKPFLEIILKPAHVYSGLMNIPLEFVKSYMSAHRQTARLKHSNKSWLVKLISYGERLVFSAGWRKFVADNTLKRGDVCRFKLIRRNDYAFNVAIVRGNGTRNKAQGTKTTRSSSNREAGKSEEMKGLNSIEEGRKRTVEVNIEDASCKFMSNCPFFQIVLSPTYVSNGFLVISLTQPQQNIPSNFRKSYMNQRRATATLGHSNKWWVVNVKGYGSRGFHFCGGWNKFVEENSLQVGDVCSFEMIEKDKYVFKVSIGRGVNNSNPSKV